MQSKQSKQEQEDNFAQILNLNEKIITLQDKLASTEKTLSKQINQLFDIVKTMQSSITELDLEISKLGELAGLQGRRLGEERL